MILKITVLAALSTCFTKLTLRQSSPFEKSENITFQVIHPQDIPVSKEAIKEVLFSIPHLISPILREQRLDFRIKSKKHFLILPHMLANIWVSSRFLTFRNIRI